MSFGIWRLKINFTSSANIVPYEPELKSLMPTSVVLARTVKSLSNDKTNLICTGKGVKLKAGRKVH